MYKMEMNEMNILVLCFTPIIHITKTGKKGTNKRMPKGLIKEGV